MKEITCKDRDMYPFNLRKLGRIKKLFEDSFGNVYYIRDGKKKHMESAGSLVYPYFYEDDNGKLSNISYWEYADNPRDEFSGRRIYIEMMDDCESVQLWEEVM